MPQARGTCTVQHAAQHQPQHAGSCETWLHLDGVLPNLVPRVPSPTPGILMSGKVVAREPPDVLGGEDVHEDALQVVARFFQCKLIVTCGHFADSILGGLPQCTLQHHTRAKENVVVRAGAQSVVDAVLAGRPGDGRSRRRFEGEDAETAVLAPCAWFEPLDHTVEHRVHATAMHRLFERVAVQNGTAKERGRSDRIIWHGRLQLKVHPAPNVVNALHGDVVLGTIEPLEWLFHSREQSFIQLWTKSNPLCQNPFASRTGSQKRAERIHRTWHLLKRL